MMDLVVARVESWGVSSEGAVSAGAVSDGWERRARREERVSA